VLQDVTNRPGPMLASSGEDGIELWDVVNNKRMRVLDQYESYASSIAFSPAGEKLALGDDDGMIILWDVDSGEKLWSGDR